MKSISKILKQALRKSAQELVKKEKEFVFEGSWCDKYQKQLEKGINPNPQPSSLTEGQHTSLPYTCNPYQNRIPNDWSSPGPVDACASQGTAVKCSQIDPNYNGTLANLCSQGLTSGVCVSGFSRIKLFPPSGPPMTTNNACEGGHTLVAGDYMLSHGGGGQGVGSWIPWLIVEANQFSDMCDGPRLGHHVCNWSPSGCTDQTAINYSPSYSNDCTGDPTYPANCIGGATGPNCCCIYPGPGCTDPIADNYSVGATSDDGSCEYRGCTDPSANNYSFNGTPFPAVTPQLNGPGPYDPTGNGGVAIDDGSCQYPTTGCLDCPNCSNYNPNVQSDDGSCLGCIDPSAINFEPNADVDDGSCIYLSFDCVQGLCEENIQGTGTHASLSDCLASQECDRWECVEEWVPTPIGTPKTKAINEKSFSLKNAASNMLKEQGQIGIDPILTVDDLDNALCVEPPGGCLPLQAPWGPISTMWQPYPVCKCLAPSVEPPPGSIVNGCYRCDDGRYDPLTKTWDPECEFFEEEECEEKCIPKGCTDPNALNYDPSAQVDDGSCMYPSCDNLPLLLSNPNFSGVLAGNNALIQDVYDIGQANNQINGVLDGNSIFCLEQCGGWSGNMSTQFPCDCCGPKNCDEIGTHPNAVPVDCYTCGDPNPAYTGACHNINNWQTLSTYPPNTTFYSTLADCQANIGNDESCVPPEPSCANDPNFCQTNPYMTPGGECWICHMGTECMPMYDYLQYGSGPPGSVGTQTYMMNWLIKTGNTFQTPQGSDLYCTEQQCMTATGCSAYSGYSPIPKKADPALDTELPIDDFSTDVDQIINPIDPREPEAKDQEKIQEGIQIRGKLLDKIRMAKLADIKKK